MKAPFPWFGGKSRAADIVWERLGNVPNYVEPFAGSLAVLLMRPHAARTETVNDKDCFLSNFWRSIRMSPDETARWADFPVCEADLLARHRWLDAQSGFIERMKADPEFHDPKVAGWWVWGLCSWIGSGWCMQRGDGDQPQQIPHLGNAGMGINRKLPHLGNAGMGINRKLPHLGNAGRGDAIREYFRELSTRLRNTRIACGDWERVLGESVTVNHGTTAVFLDPPYTDGDVDYSAGGCGGSIANAVRDWAIENGSNPKLRIALCGYESEHAMPKDWECVAWKARGGYGSQAEGQGRANSNRERIWFSPACIKPGELLL